MRIILLALLVILSGCTRHPLSEAEVKLVANCNAQGDQPVYEDTNVSSGIVCSPRK
jgi:hypothetical protein